jgi:hypothetical protein
MHFKPEFHAAHATNLMCFDGAFHAAHATNPMCFNGAFHAAHATNPMWFNGASHVLPPYYGSNVGKFSCHAPPSYS